MKTYAKLTMDDVWYQYGEDLRRVEDQIRKDLKSNVPLIDTISTYIFKSGGKRFRPLLLILTSEIAGYSGDARIELASVIELIHTATLLHDDVLDEAHIRRGNKTARMLWGNQASILVGDYLYTKAQCNIVSFRNHEINEAVADATRAMTKGELAQLQFNSDLSITEADYLDIIANKTASLISTACRIGGILGGCTPEKKEMIESFGWNIGMAFQVSDDTLDYAADKKKLGKTIGKDLQEGKVTLPLLTLLQRCSKEEVSVIEQVIRLSDFSEENLGLILKLMNKHDVINYSFDKAREYVEKAKKSLLMFDDSTHLQALFTVADYVVDREL
ncbi:MAG: polyprenyl synthetase family protein [Nitrospirae bacterium]|nr:polyprenyl synthetase family protein [Nitrospirota bacterium]